MPRARGASASERARSGTARDEPVALPRECGALDRPALVRQVRERRGDVLGAAEPRDQLVAQSHCA